MMTTLNGVEANVSLSLDETVKTYKSTTLICISVEIYLQYFLALELCTYGFCVKILDGVEAHVVFSLLMKMSNL